MKHKALLIAVFFVLQEMVSGVQFAYSQDAKTAFKGTPRIIHYTKKDFQSDPQFWCMAQDHEGLLYLGNNDGALIFDGETWKLVRLPNNSSIRSLRVGMDGKVYAGGFNEFGVIKRDEFGQFYYESLIQLLRPEDRSFENIWQIHEAQGFMVFRSTELVIALSNNKALTLPSGNYDFSAVVNNRLFLKDDSGLNQVDLVSMEVRKIIDINRFGGEDLLALLPGFSGSETFALTKQGSFFRLDAAGNTLEFWKKFLPDNSNNLYTSAIRGSDGNFYIGTLRSRVISIGKDGERNDTNAAFRSIQDNTVLNLFESSEGNIWVLLNNGLDCIDLSSPLTLLYEDASIYDVKLHAGKMYVATNQGVVVSAGTGMKNLANDSFSAVRGLEGQAWSMQILEDQLVCSHDRGIFVVNGKEADQVPGVGGVWKIIPVLSSPHRYLVCTYDGIFLMEYQSGKGFVVRNRIEGFRESSRDILQSDEQGVFWICHGYKGVFRIKIDDQFSRVLSLEHFKDENGLPTPFNINVSTWKDQIVFTTNNGIFTYNKESGRFEPHLVLNTIFGTKKNVRQIREVGERTWFVHDNEVGYFFTARTSPELQKGYFLQLKGSFNPSMECIVPVNDNTVLLGTNSGLFAFDLNFSASPRRMPSRISYVKYRRGQNELSAPLFQEPDGVQRLSYDATGIRFGFSAPAFQDKLNIEYSYWLEGAEEDWSPWGGESQKEYSLLPAGNYAFHIRARSLLGESADEAVYRFQIAPAWYDSQLAWFIYIVSGISAIVLGSVIINRRLRKENEKKLDEEMEKRRVLELELQRVKLLQEKDAIKKDKDQLEEDVIYKSKELANYTMLLVKKRDLLSLMHDELKELKESVKNEAGRQRIRDLIKKINMNLQDEEHIQVFEANFERVHHEFFAQLKSSFPDLTPKELQLCAFVKMNLTNKEIASILNISVRGVETARYRLRKRLGIAQVEDMGHFLEKLYASGPESWQEHLG